MKITSVEKEFLKESNAIEKEYSNIAQLDAINAWKYACSRDILTVDDFLMIHFFLMKRLNRRIAGKYRKCAVRIGSQYKEHEKPEFFEERLQYLADKLINSYRLEEDEHEEECKKCHILFEEIHPFEDGNGRTGRIIYNWQRMKLGLPIHVIHEGKEQYEYYDWFRN